MDRNFNLEELKEDYIYVDTQAPEFEIVHEEVTEGASTDLTVSFEGLEEAASCTLILKPIRPGGRYQTVNLGFEAEKTTAFQDLPGVMYDLEATCEDRQGNSITKTETLVFDLEINIDINAPKGAVNTSLIKFDITTLVPAVCYLYKFSGGTFSLVTDFISLDGLNHLTPLLDVSASYPQNYQEVAADYQALCIDSSTDERYEDYFFFTIDKTAGIAQILLDEDPYPTLKPEGNNWEAFLRSSADVGFECDLNNEPHGFDCRSYYYCLTEQDEDCRNIVNLRLEDYTELASPLSLDESSSICYYAIDGGGNKPYKLICGNIVINGFTVFLKNPEHYTYQKEIWGVSKTPNFDLKFFTPFPTSECRFDFLPGFNYNSVPAFKILTPDSNGDYTYFGFPQGTGASAYGSNGGVKSIYIKCKDALEQITSEKKVNLEYDHSAPRITAKKADPNPVIEGVNTLLTVETDDRTVCKYDNQDKTEYEDMDSFFEGSEENILKTKHQSTYQISFTGLKKDYAINVLCKNGAGEVSSLETIEFKVDYTQLGNIIRIWPNGHYLTSYNLTAEVETSKTALCQLRKTDYLPMTTADGKLHTYALSSLTEGFYQLPVYCDLGDHRVENQVTFTIDRTKPVVSIVYDGNYSCGADTFKVMVYTNEGNLSAYYYEIYNKGASSNYNNASSNRTASPAGLLLNGTVPAQLPIEVPSAGLIIGNKYTIKVGAVDAAGNIGALSESDGVLMTESNYSACKDDSPTVIFSQNTSSCTQTTVEMLLQSSVGTSSFKYSQSSSPESCEATSNYNGQRISFNSDGWICYDAKNNLGRNVTGDKRIIFEDSDGDKVRDRCDICPGTLSGKIVDQEGCAEGQSTDTEDSDGDSLPDAWEKQFNSEKCPLNYESIDSNEDLIRDNSEDYDNDGYSNYQEYTDGYNPCLADAPPKEEADNMIAPGKSGGDNLLPTILLILGLLLFLGGTGYLIYYYKFSSPKYTPRKTPVFEVPNIPAPAKILTGWKKSIVDLRKRRQERLREMSKEELFGKFSKDSEKIPHLNALLNKKEADESHIQKVAQSYLEHKGEIKPGLKPSEKNVFDKLEDIAKQSRNKDIKEILSKDEAGNIFNQLKDISKKRKK